jgi:hypothetical protein
MDLIQRNSNHDTYNYHRQINHYNDNDNDDNSKGNFYRFNIIGRTSTDVRQIRRQRIGYIHKAISDGEYCQLHNLLVMPVSSSTSSTTRNNENGVSTIGDTTTTSQLLRPVSTSTSASQSASNMFYDTRLLWETNGTGGWTACHYAAGNFVPTEWWEWILQLASSTVPSIAEQQQQEQQRTSSTTTSFNNNKKNNNRFLHTKNALGQTFIDIFFRSYLRPVRCFFF